MRNDDFWNKCSSGSIREKIAIFIDNSPTLSHFKGKKYYDLEDELVTFIKENRQTIFGEVEREYRREDVSARIKEKYGKKSRLLKHIDTIVDEWQRVLDSCDSYWESFWDALDCALDYLDSKL